MRQLPFKLTDHEKAERGERAATFNFEHGRLVLERKDIMATYNEKLRDLSSKVSGLLNQISEGIENREVECVEVKNYEANQMEYWFEGEVKFHREMSPEERQMELDERPKAKRGRKPKWQRLAPNYVPKIEDKSSEIAEVYKTKTSRKTKHSMVDGAI
jgi:hypothetical protein